MTSDKIRKSFLKFFRERGHRIFPSDTLIPSSDPTLLFTSAGMVPFKNYFLGKAKLKEGRAVSCQRCLRTTDIEKVGISPRHLTFFEMLGNFSFGDYFKKEAIAWAWEFLTQKMDLPQKNLYVSVFREDEEAQSHWKLLLPESRIIRLGEETNFWRMGETGPCGPCSEILLDTGEKNGCGKPTCGPGCDCDRFLEIWNLVFTQYDRKSDGKLTPLPQKNIDTGMGLERLAAVVQGKVSPFDSDLFQSLLQFCHELFQEGTDLGRREASRIIADHARAVSFLISDGILPSNEGRGYVLRRLIRRAARQGWVLGRKEPFLCKIVPAVTQRMENAYPELSERRGNIQSIVETEEKNFMETIEAGTRILENEIGELRQKAAGDIRLSGERVFYIYDTYGLDKEIQKEIVRDWGRELLFSEEEYEQAKEKATGRARKGWKGSGDMATSAYAEIQRKIGKSRFRGYEKTELTAKIAALLKEGRPCDEIISGETAELFLSETPFYAEAGGQVGDTGSLETSTGEARVLDTKIAEGLHIHQVRVTKGKILVNQKVTARVDEARRENIRKNHTATHLLHKALRETLGKHVIQAGSLVAPERLRFDFTHPKPLSQEEIGKVEDWVNTACLKNLPVYTKVGPLAQAKKMGAMALFGEKYENRVRSILIGKKSEPKNAVSLELCGGTHCAATGEIGLFKITEEQGLSAGVRRIEALTGPEALHFTQTQQDKLRGVREMLQTSEEEILPRLEKVLQENRQLRQKISRNELAPAKTNWDSILAQAQERGGVRFLIHRQDGISLDNLRLLSDTLRDKLGGGIVVVLSMRDGAVSFVVSVSKELTDRFHAGKLADILAKKVGGTGGGRADFAQGGGKDASQMERFLKEAPEIIFETRA